MEAEVTRDEHPEPVARLVRRIDRLIEFHQKIFRSLFAEPEEQLLLAVDVIIERARLHADFLRQHPQVHRSVAMLREQLDSRRTKVAQRFRAVGAGFPHRYSCPPLTRDVESIGSFSLSKQAFRHKIQPSM